MRVISLGWGVQSWALAAMTALGELPPVDAAIHADTTHERAETYEFAAKWTPWLEERGVRVVTVTPPEHRADPFYSVRTNSTFIPAFTSWPAGDSSGMLRRQCTGEWKIRPIRRWIQEHRDGQMVETWLGITLDEVTRMRQADVQYVVNRFPFVEYLDRPWTRMMVMQWLERNGLEIPVKSSCVFCPYHDRATWREIRAAGNGDWERAVAVDEAIRNKREGYLCYVHRNRVPLAEVDLRDETDHGQLTLWDEECEGMCFL